MAEVLHDGEFWLPSRFLSEEMGFLETKLPCEFPYCDSSPVESVVSSTETESDEEDYMAGLTRRMAHSTLEDDDREAAQKVAVMAGSPQSTLCRSLDSNGSQGGSDGPTQASSPPSTPLNQEDDAWDFLCAAADQMVGMKMNEEGEKYHGRGLLGPPNKPVAVSVPSPELAPAVVPKHGLHMNPADVTAYPLQRCWSDNGRDVSALAMHFELLKQQQSNWGMQQQQRQQAKIAQAQQMQSRAGAVASASPKFGRPLGLPPSAWPPLQKASPNAGLREAPHQSPSASAGMRAVFLGNNGSRRESSGTGVFLPRRVGSSPDYRKKSGCSTVLLPARVVQALNLGIDMGSAQSNYYLGSLVHDRDSSSLNVDPRHIARNRFLPPQKRTIRPQPVLNGELRLPQEWTY